MALYLYKEFLADLRDEGDATFARRVLSKVIDTQGAFIEADSQDHRYDGIDDAWIRYVSKGGIGIRVIFVRKGSDVYLYRAGPHSVENNLTRPKKSADILEVVPTPAAVSGSSAGGLITPPLGLLLQNYRPELLRVRVLGRRFLRHKEVILVSPYLSMELFHIYSAFGKMLQDLIDEGCMVTVITRPPSVLDELRSFEKLEANGYSIFFHPLLHAKLFLFDVQDMGAELGKQGRRMALVGSANLTVKGLGIGATTAENPLAYEELVYELPDPQFESAMDYATYLTVSASDIPKERVRLTRERRI